MSHEFSLETRQYFARVHVTEISFMNDHDFAMELQEKEVFRELEDGTSSGAYLCRESVVSCDFLGVLRYRASSDDSRDVLVDSVDPRDLDSASEMTAKVGIAGATEAGVTSVRFSRPDSALALDSVA